MNAQTAPSHPTAAVGAAPQPTSGTRLADTVVLVTGASRGIGEAISRACALQGATVVLSATRQDLLDQVRADLISQGVPAERLDVMPLDVTDRTACFATVQAIQTRFGRIDALVNNAGIYQSKRFLDYTPEDFQRLLDVNLFGLLHMTQAVLPAMLERGYGRILNIASTAGKWGSRNQSAYNTSKHAVVGLTRCVAMETAAQGVTVNAICPGFVQTDMVETLKAGYAQATGSDGSEVISAVLGRIPIGRVLQAEEIASLALHLVSRESSGMTGQSLLVDGGMLMC
jgi:NAD(P)-dependent dehydrogenase (short-subunit alcohol dehydrogenase family)